MHQCVSINFVALTLLETTSEVLLHKIGRQRVPMELGRCTAASQTVCCLSDSVELLMRALLILKRELVATLIGKPERSEWKNCVLPKEVPQYKAQMNSYPFRLADLTRLLFLFFQTQRRKPMGQTLSRRISNLSTGLWVTQHLMTDIGAVPRVPMLAFTDQHVTISWAWR